MPELPEVQTIVSQLREEIVGQRIRNIEVIVPKMVLGDIKRVEPLKIKDVRRKAKLIIIELENSFHLVIHLKLTGQLFYIPKGKTKTKTGQGINKYTRVVFNFQDGSRIIFNDLRKFGYVKILNEKELERNFLKENYGPEPLSPEFTFGKFRELLERKPKSRIKPLLMDQTFIAGIGNIYSDEVLFYAAVHPLRKVQDLTDKEVKEIYKGISKILNQAIKHKGTSIDTYRTTTGEGGSYAFYRKVYRRKGQKCLGCGGVVNSLKIGGRTSYFCPKCQK